MTRSLERLVLDALPATVYAVDLEGRITLASGAAPPGDAADPVGRAIGDALADVASPAQVEHAMDVLLAGRTPTIAWETSVGADGEQRVVLVQAGALHGGRSVSGFVFTTVDVTAGRRVEHRRRLEAVGEVAAGVAHELRNPLFGISSAAQLLRYRVREDPVVEKNVGRILREVERLNGMVTSLLEYGRPAPPKLRLEDPEAVWDEVLESQRGLLESKALRVARARAPAHARCRLDPEQLSQAFLHLLVNAADAAPEGTDLALATQLLPSGAWRCRLSNGGPPVAADLLPRVFDLFVSTKPGGTGIGLALCQRIVEEHDGTIAFASTAEGTAVTVTLPMAGVQTELALGAPGETAMEPA